MGGILSGRRFINPKENPMALFTVHVCADGNPGIGPALRSFRQYPAAKRYAERKANDYHYGTLIVDDVREIIDWGNGWTLAKDCEVEVPPPAYARR
jgi:hypothetical protein